MEYCTILIIPQYEEEERQTMSKNHRTYLAFSLHILSVDPLVAILVNNLSIIKLSLRCFVNSVISLSNSVVT